MKLSVALCTYNGEKFLEKQLDSIFYQVLQVDEVIVCDDNSTDGSAEILTKFQTKFPDLIKVIFNDSSLGTVRNFEKAISLTTGDLIFLSDQDDVWKNSKTQIMVEFFERVVDCKLLFSNGELIDEEGISLNSTLWDKWGFDAETQSAWKSQRNSFRDLIINKNKITGATVCFHKSMKQKCLPIEAPLGYWHDAWLGLHAAANEGLYFIEQSLIEYRIHDDQQIGINSKIDEKVINKSNDEFVRPKVFFNNIRTLYPSKRHLVPKRKAKTLMNKINKFLISKRKYYDIFSS